MIAASILSQAPGSLEQISLYVMPLIGSVMMTYAMFNLVADLRRKEDRRVADRLRDRSSGFGDSDGELAAKASILRRKEAETGTLGSMIGKLGFIPAFQRGLDQANIPFSATTVLINLLGFGSVGYIACYFLKQAQWVCISVGFCGLLLPLAAIWFKRRMRLNKFLNQLPDVFELMSQALRAGHSLANAIMIVSQQLPDPVGTEFARVFHEQNLGIKIEDAMQDMAQRVGLMDVRFFVTAVLIQRQTGGDLAEVLDNISDVIRDRIKLFGSVKALTAEGRLSGYVLLALPIVVFIVELVINPNYAQVMIDEPMGQYMLIGAGVSQVFGLAMIQKIINIKV